MNASFNPSQIRTNKYIRYFLLNKIREIADNTFMETNLCEALRKIIIDELMEVESIKKAWPIWKKKIDEILGNNPSGMDLLDLGDHLSEIFKTTRTAGRSQSHVSSGGKAWELLATWYLNLICANTRMVAFHKRSWVPRSINNAVTVSYRNHSCNTETDIVVVLFPENYHYQRIPSTMVKSKIKKFYFDLDCSELQNFEVGIIQCKTNWNDNAQIPMLWDMVYSAERQAKMPVTVGIEGCSVKHFGHFTYSFLTVPTTDSEKIKMESTCVLRVQQLSGGNFWGRKSKAGVASSIKEIFNKNFKNAFDSTIQNANSNLRLLSKELSYFKLYNKDISE